MLIRKVACVFFKVEYLFLICYILLCKSFILTSFGLLIYCFNKWFFKDLIYCKIYLTGYVNNILQI